MDFLVDVFIMLIGSWACLAIWVAAMAFSDNYEIKKKPSKGIEQNGPDGR